MDWGLLLLHMVGRNEHGYGADSWIDGYIFPNGELSTIAGIGKACEGLFADFLDERLRRMWRYHLLSCASAFRARDIQLWQWALAKDGEPDGWRRPEDNYSSLNKEPRQGHAWRIPVGASGLVE